jgi:hypothetical protein
VSLKEKYKAHRSSSWVHGYRGYMGVQSKGVVQVFRDAVVVLGYRVQE